MIKVIDTPPSSHALARTAQHTHSHAHGIGKYTEQAFPKLATVAFNQRRLVIYNRRYLLIVTKVALQIVSRLQNWYKLSKLKQIAELKLLQKATPFLLSKEKSLKEVNETN